jgi:hypothetical protein
MAVKKILFLSILFLNNSFLSAQCMMFCSCCCYDEEVIIISDISQPKKRTKIKVNETKEVEQENISKTDQKELA